MTYTKEMEETSRAAWQQRLRDGVHPSRVEDVAERIVRMEKELDALRQEATVSRMAKDLLAEAGLHPDLGAAASLAVGFTGEAAALAMLKTNPSGAERTAALVLQRASSEDVEAGLRDLGWRKRVV